MDQAIKLSLQGPVATVGSIRQGPAAAVALASTPPCKEEKVAAVGGTVSPMKNSVRRQPRADVSHAVRDNRRLKPVRMESAQIVSPDSCALHLGSLPESAPAKRACTASR